MQKRVAAGSTLTLSAGRGLSGAGHTRAHGATRGAVGSLTLYRLRSVVGRIVCARLRFGREWSEDQLDLVMTWIVEVPIGGLAQVKRGVALLVAEVGIGAVFE